MKDLDRARVVAGDQAAGHADGIEGYEDVGQPGCKLELLQAREFDLFDRRVGGRLAGRVVEGGDGGQDVAFEHAHPATHFGKVDAGDGEGAVHVCGKARTSE